jgi:Ca2+-binding RTX toxin-like protein
MSSLTPLSVFTLSYDYQPYPIPNFSFAYTAGPDGRDFLENKLSLYYDANSSEAYNIFKNVPGIETDVDPLFIAGQTMVGFPEAGGMAEGAYPNLYYYDSQIGTMPGALEANLSFQSFKTYLYSQAEALGVDFSEDNRTLIDQGFDALIIRYASILEDGNLMETGSNPNGSGGGKDYVDLWADLAGVETSNFYNVAPGFAPLWGNANASITDADRHQVYSKIFDKATTVGSTYYEFYQGSVLSSKGSGINDFDIYAPPVLNAVGAVGNNVPTVLQTLLGDFKDLLDSGVYNGKFADGGLKIESGIRSLLEAGVDANPLNTAQGFGYAGNASPTAPLGLADQTILERMPGYEFSGFNTWINQYGSRVEKLEKVVGTDPATDHVNLSDAFINGDGFFPDAQSSAALRYDNFSDWEVSLNPPIDQWVPLSNFPTPQNESLEDVQFFKQTYTKSGLYLEVPDTPVNMHIVLSSAGIDEYGDIDEEFAQPSDGQQIKDLIMGLSDGSANFAHTKDGDDVIMGCSANDIILSGDGNDKIVCMDGDDLINPGAGYDIAFLGAGKDGVVIREASMTGELNPVSYLTLPDFSREDTLYLENGIDYEVFDDGLRLKLSYDGNDKIVVLSGSSTLKDDGSGNMTSSVTWDEIIANGQVQSI